MKKLMLSFAIIAIAVLNSTGQTLHFPVYTTNGPQTNGGSINANYGTVFYLSVDAYSTGGGEYGDASSHAVIKRWNGDTLAKIIVDNYNGPLKEINIRFTDSNRQVNRGDTWGTVSNRAPGVVGMAAAGISW